MTASPTAGSVLRGAVRGQRRDIVVSTLLNAIFQLAESAVPVAVGVVIDLGITRADAGGLLLGLAITVGVFVVLAAAAIGGYWLSVRAERNAGHEVRLAVARRILDPAGGAPGRAGELVSLAGSDADRTGGVTRAITDAGAVAALAGGAVVLLGASTLLGLVVLGGVVVVLVASRLLARPLVGRAEAEQSTLAATTAVATDLITGLRVLKGIGAERAAAATYRTSSRSALRARLAATSATGVFSGTTALLSGVLLVVVAWLGGRLALAGSISVGELVAALGLAQFLIGPLRELTDLVPVLAGARGAAGRVAAVLAAPPAVRAGTGELPDGPRALRVQLPGGPAIVVAAGEHLGVVLPDATALIDVLARDVDGVVDVDGTDLQTVPLDAARATVLVARHGATLFEGPIAADLDATALAASAADEVVATVGPDTTITERGRNLSGGQRQRLTLARALAADAPVLVLHDPTTAVDAATEHRIAAGIAQLRAGRTTVLVTSSPALLARCSRVVLVLDGEIVAGTHGELVADARYRELVLS